MDYEYYQISEFRFQEFTRPYNYDFLTLIQNSGIIIINNITTPIILHTRVHIATKGITGIGIIEEVVPLQLNNTHLILLYSFLG